MSQAGQPPGSTVENEARERNGEIWSKDEDQGVPQTGLAPKALLKILNCATWSPPFLFLWPRLGPSPGFPMVPPPNGPLLPTQLGEDVQQLMGHNAASSAKVHGSGKTKVYLTPRVLQSF